MKNKQKYNIIFYEICSFFKLEVIGGLIISVNQVKINNQITAHEVRVIIDNDQHEQVGVISIKSALAMANKLNLDLVEIAPNAKPPVCKIMDYGKFKYSLQKKQHQSKLKQKKVITKEIKMRPTTDEHDFQTKIKKIKQFLQQGCKIKITVQFRGREVTHQELGLKKIERIQEEFNDLIIIESKLRIDGRNAVMVIAPNPKNLNDKPTVEQKHEN